MSFVSRLTIQPVFWRLKKSSESFWMWAKSVAAQVEDDVLADPARQVGLGVARAEVDAATSDEGDDDLGEHVHVAGARCRRRWRP